ncbi:MAG: hypothetical protein M3N10_08380 [Actinomycetota bacterium]|nr:hypothetical protein [Actinomycetota bacterium]
MHSLNDCEVWKRRAEEIRREVEKNRLAGHESSRRSRALLWELRRLGGKLAKRFRWGKRL